MEKIDTSTHKLTIFNSINRKKERFTPLFNGHIGMYVCGPTVYNDVHLGNVRTFVCFDMIFRYLKYIGYKVRYIRNITDVGHLLDSGEDRISKRAILEQVEPMEIVQKYTTNFHKTLELFNTLPPSIEPRATGHIIEQIDMVQQILDNGYGYITNGSVYFDTMKFHESKKCYGQLSGRVIEDLMAESRDDLKNQSEKRHPSDFAIWMKADETHILKWKSPWSLGFPGWHLECSAMSTKYLGEKFDIHGGGNDLKFPHHENEIAQNIGACNCSPANYWLHTNMLLLNGKKMSKSDGNTISPEELISGNSRFVTKPYTPMVLRFYIMQAHYRSTLDITDEALLASEKGYKKLMNTLSAFMKTDIKDELNEEIEKELVDLTNSVLNEMDDDFNTPKAIAKLFEIVPILNNFVEQKPGFERMNLSITQYVKSFLTTFIGDVLGIELNKDSANNEGKISSGLMDLIIELRKDARQNKDWATADKIRNSIISLGIIIKDGKDETTWHIS